MDSPFSKLKVTELREQLQAKGLSTKGLKKDLVERLEAAATEQVSGDHVNDEVPVKEDKPVEPVDVQEEVVVENKGPDAPMGEEDDSNLDPDAPLVDMESQKETSTIQQTSTMPKGVTSVLKISNFVRPFAINDAKSLLETYGKVITFWMDPLRTHAFIEYDTLHAAAMCKQELDGVQWPERTGKQLSIELSSVEFMNAAMNAPRIGGKRNVDDIVESGEVSGPKELKTLDELFCKTRTQPHLYYLPVQHP